VKIETIKHDGLLLLMILYQHNLCQSQQQQTERCCSMQHMYYYHSLPAGVHTVDTVVLYENILHLSPKHPGRGHGSACSVYSYTDLCPQEQRSKPAGFFPLHPQYVGKEGIDLALRCEHTIMAILSI